MDSRFVLPDGEKIRRLRQDHFWTQDQLAEQAGVHKRTVERAEEGKRLQRKTLSIIAQVWGLSPEQFVISGTSSALRHESVERTTPDLDDPAPVSGRVIGHATRDREEGQAAPSEADTSWLPAPVRCTGCGFDNPASVQFCTACGLPLQHRCPSCGCENPPGARFCGACATPLTLQTPLPAPAQADAQGAPQPEQATPSGPRSAAHMPSESERRQLTVLCCRLVGFAEHSEPLEPEELLDVVHDYHAMCAEEVRRFEGHIAQYQGDGLVVHFGYPRVYEDDAHRAVHTGLGIVEGMERLNRSLKRERGRRLAVRVGIHTGMVVLTTLGRGDQPEPLTLGNTPTIATQLRDLATPGTVVISPATLRLIEGYFASRALGTHILDDPAEPLAVYQVLQEHTAQSRFEVTATKGLTPLVGREQEVGLLRQRWEQAKEGMGQVVLLSGEAGIGKSRLVQVLREHLEGEAHTQVACYCSPYYQNSALYPVVESVQRLLQWSEEDTPQEKLRKLEGALESYSFSLAEVVPLLAALLSLPLPERYLPLTLTPQRQKQKTLEALLAWLLQDTERQPMCFVVEDLHWADPSTLEFLSLLIDQAPMARLLILLIFRLDFRPPWASRSRLTHLTLSRLTRRQAEVMAERVAGGKTLPGEVLQKFVAKTDGVPLFVEELMKMVLESGLVKEHEGRYVLTGPLPSLAIPATLHDSLMARLDRLEMVKSVAQLAATIGRQCPYALLHAVSSTDEATLHQALGQLVEAELLYQRGLPPHATYTFKHALIQEAAYQSLFKNTRQQSHRQIAQVLVERFPETVETQPELLAQHYTQAGLAAPAVPYWLRAGQRAVERSANIEAISHLTQGLEVLNTLPDTPERAQQELTLQLALGVPLVLIKGHTAPEVEYAYTRAHELCQQVGDSLQRFSALRGLQLFYSGQGLYRRAYELTEQCGTLVQDLRDPALLQETHVMLGSTLFYLGEPVSARAHLEQGIALYQPQQGHSLAFSRSDDPTVICLSHLSWVLWMLGYPDQALTRSREACALAQQLSQPYNLAHALAFASALSMFRREAQHAQEQAEATIALSQEHGFSRWLSVGMAWRGWALAEQGATQEALAQIRQAMAMRRTAMGELGQSQMPLRLAEIYGKAGQAEAGLCVLTEAFATLSKGDEHRFEAELYRLKGELLLQRAAQQDTRQAPLLAPSRVTEAGRGGVTPVFPLQREAETCFRQAIDVAHSQQAKSLELRAVMSLSRLWQRQGKRTEAWTTLESIYGWFTEGLDTPDLQEGRALLEALQ